MSFLNPVYLLALGLVLVPVALHLLLRARPKKLIFPALRLIQSRRQQNSRRLRLRHLWLLLLRMLVIAALILALTRPTLPAANYSLSWRELVTAGGICAVALGIYFGLLALWQRRKVPRHDLLARRTSLRGGLGLATLVLLLLLVGWPYQQRVAAEITAPAPAVAENLPVAAVFVIDTSLSLSYQHQGQSVLAVACDLVRDQLGRLPPGSRVAIAENSGDIPGIFSSDFAAVQDRLSTLTTHSLSRSLNETLDAAITLQEEDRRRILGEQGSLPDDQRQDRVVREIYVVTDLARTAWRLDSTSLLKERLAEQKWIGVYLLDVGVEQPVNAGLQSVKLSQQSVSSGQAITVTAAITAASILKPEATVELWLQGDDGQLVKVGQQSLRLEPQAETGLSFPVENLKGRYRQGELRLIGNDPLLADNVAYFTVQIHPPLEVLVVAERREEANVWMEALAPGDLVKAGRAKYRTTFAPTSKLAETDLQRFQAVCLIHAARPDARTWQHLADYVKTGGGLFLSLGAHSTVAGEPRADDGLDPLAWNSEAARQIVPAELKASLQFSPAATLDWTGVQNPLTRSLSELGVLPVFTEIDIRRYWSVTPGEDTSVIARYARPPLAPALIERRIGRGRVMLLTTAVDSVAWNDLSGGWILVVLADRITQQLTGLGEAGFNHVIGDDVGLPLNAAQKLQRVVLRMPGFKQRQQEVTGDGDFLLLTGLTDPGSYQVEAVEPMADAAQGFSLNLSGAESDFRRIEPGDLDRLLGEKRYSISRDPQTLERSLLAGRLGQEVYGLLLACLIGFFVLEQLTAAWFYDREGDSRVPETA